MDNISKKHNTTVGGNIRSARSSTDELKHVAAPVKQTSAGDDEIKDQKPKELTVDEMEQILSLEPEDRKIKIFRIGKHPSSLTEEYDDNFYDLTTEDIKAMIKQQKIIEKTIRSDAFLSEEAKRKRLLNSKLNPPSITVRIKLADLYVIQAEFRILEQVSKLYELAREYTTIGKDSNFKLIVPPKNILNQGVTFLESGIKSNMSVLFNGGIFPAVKEEYRSKIIDFEPMPDCSYNLARRVEEDVANDTNYQGSNREARGNLLKKTLGCSNPTVKSNRLDNPGRKKKNVPSWFKAIKK